MCLCLSISSASVLGIRKFILQIPRIYATLMGHWIAGQLRNMMRIVMCKSNLRMGENILTRVLMMLCEVFLRAHLSNSVNIYMLGSGRSRVCGLGDALFTIVVFYVPLYRAYLFPWVLMFNWYRKGWT